MKKLKPVVLAMLFSMLFGITAMAKTSPVGVAELQTNKAEGVTVKQADGTEIPDATVEVAVENWENDWQEAEELETAKGMPGNYNLMFLNNITLKVNGQPVTLAGGSIRLTFSVPNVNAGSDVIVLHYNGSVWESDSVSDIECGDGSVSATFSDLSPVAVMVRKPGSSSHKSSRPEPENTFWATPLSSGAAVMVNGAAADLQIGPATRTFSEADAQILLGTTGACNVYTADLWLLDQATKNIVLPGAEGALVTLNVPGVAKGSNVKIRLWPNGTNDYVDLVPEEVGNGYVRVRFSAMGQVAVCTSGTGTAAPAVTANTGSGRLSPRTSEGMMIYGIEAVALLSLLGFVVFRKKYMTK